VKVEKETGKYPLWHFFDNLRFIVLEQEEADESPIFKILLDCPCLVVCPQNFQSFFERFS
jgi:hypothetical protein